MHAPRIFISYSHDSQEHINAVLLLSERLRQDGIDAHLDQYVNGSPPEGWARWTSERISEADAVLIVCSEVYARRVSDVDPPGAGKGVRWEGSLIYQHLYNEMLATVRFIPVVLSRHDVKYIVPNLQASTYYVLDSQEGYENLLRRLTQQPAIVRSQLGKRATLFPEEPRTLYGISVFLCHCSKDKSAVRDLYAKLKGNGATPWLDEEDLLPGQQWETEIPKAVRDADAVVVCLSTEAVNRAGYFHKEIAFALDVLDRQPESAIYLIPVKLADCEIPERLKHLHCVSVADDGGYQKLLRSLAARAKQLKLSGVD